MFVYDKDGRVRISAEYARQAIEAVNADAVEYPDDAKEGKQIADNLRKFFPDVSDHDMGSLLMVFVQALAKIASLGPEAYPYALDKVSGVYTHSGADFLKTVVEFEGMLLTQFE